MKLDWLDKLAITAGLVANLLLFVISTLVVWPIWPAKIFFALMVLGAVQVGVKVWRLR